LALDLGDSHGEAFGREEEFVKPCGLAVAGLVHAGVDGHVALQDAVGDEEVFEGVGGDGAGRLLASFAATRNTTERLWLTEMMAYLPVATAEREPGDQWVFCVAASTGRPGASTRTFRDFVQHERVSFDAYGMARGVGRNGRRKSSR